MLAALDDREYRLAEHQEIRLTIHDVDRKDIKRYYRPTQDNRNERQAIAGFWDEGMGSKALSILLAELRDGDTVLVKASRGAALDLLVDRLVLAAGSEGAEA